MKRKAPPRRRHAPQRPRRRKPTATRPSRGGIRKKATKASHAVPKPSYFSLLRDVENYLKVDHVQGASMQKLKREMEKRYGGRAFDVASCKMLKSAVKRLQKKGRIKKKAYSTLLKFKPPAMPAYNVFGAGKSKGVRVLPIKPSASGAHLQVARRPVAVRRHVVPIRKHAPGSAKRSSRPMASYKPPLRKRRQY